MKKQSLIRRFERWKTSRIELLRQVDSLRKENDRLQQRLIALQLAKDQAEKHAEDRRREKEVLRAKMNSQKRSSESNELLLEQLGAKITELRAEIDRLKQRKKK